MTRDLTEAEQEAIGEILEQAAKEAHAKIAKVWGAEFAVSIFACTPARTLNRYTFPSREQFRAWHKRLVEKWKKDDTAVMN